jgi:hypothetical protein
MKYIAGKHIIGKVYDLTQENMNAMLRHIEELGQAAENEAYRQMVEDRLRDWDEAKGCDETEHERQTREWYR